VADLELLTAVFHALDSGVVILDGDKRVLDWNEWFSRAAKLDLPSARGKRLDEVFAQARSARLDSTLTAALKSGVSSLLTHSLHHGLFPLQTPAGHELVERAKLRLAGLTFHARHAEFSDCRHCTMTFVPTPTRP